MKLILSIALNMVVLTACDKTKRLKDGSSPTSNQTTLTPIPAAHSDLPPALTTGRLLRIALDPGYSPMEFTTEDGQMAGFDVQYALALAEKLKHDIKIVSTPFELISTEVAAGRADLGISSLEIPMESRDVQFIEYFAMPEVYVAKAGKGLTLGQGFVGKTIGTLAISAARVTLHARMNEGHLAKVRGYESEKTAFDALERNEVDAIVVHAPTAAERVKRSAGKLISLGYVGAEQPMGIAMGRDKTELADAILNAVIALKNDGTSERIRAFWFGALPNAAGH